MIFCLQKLADQPGLIQKPETNQSIHDKTERLNDLISWLIEISSQQLTESEPNYSVLGSVILRWKKASSESNITGISGTATAEFNINEILEVKCSSHDLVDTRLLKLALYSDSIQSKDVSYSFFEELQDS